MKVILVVYTNVGLSLKQVSDKKLQKYAFRTEVFFNNAGYQLHYNYNTPYYDKPIDVIVEMIYRLKNIISYDQDKRNILFF